MQISSGQISTSTFEKVPGELCRRLADKDIDKEKAMLPGAPWHKARSFVDRVLEHALQGRPALHGALLPFHKQLDGWEPAPPRQSTISHERKQQHEKLTRSNTKTPPEFPTNLPRILKQAPALHRCLTGPNDKPKRNPFGSAF